MHLGKWLRKNSQGDSELAALSRAEAQEAESLIANNANGSHDASLPSPVPEKRPTSDKITCLDGLRGIACLLVFNYHFLWPWTPQIMLGHGAFPLAAPEPYTGWPFMPIICLLHRGRPMVAIFFAISGYVLCRHVLKAIKEHRLEAAYKSLASAVFRRAFRLYIPPLITMFLVAILAQVGVFRSEKDIFKGPDSKYINGTMTYAYARRPCREDTVSLDTTKDIAKYLGLKSPNYLLNVTGQNISDWQPVYSFCLNDTSKLYDPALIYTIGNSTEQEDWQIAWGMRAPRPKAKVEPSNQIHESLSITTNGEIARSDESSLKHPEIPPAFPPPQYFWIPRYDDWAWIQLGGSWEEHPIIHNSSLYAMGNYTRVMAEWMNPFNFGHYHPRFDPHTFTIPMEFRCSIFIYVFLLATAALKVRWRLGLGAGLAMYALQIGRWDMCIFMGAMLLSEIDLRRAARAGHARTPSAVAREATLLRVILNSKVLRWACFILALYFLSYPDAAADFTPGFITMASYVPRYYNKLSGWMFWQAIGALILLPCTLRSKTLRNLLDMPIPQWLGKVSFSFYLIHGPVLHSLGFWIMPRLFDQMGWWKGLALGYVLLLATALYLADWFHKKVDVWSMTVGRRIERHLSD